MPPDDHLTTRDAAAMTTMSMSWLEKARRRGVGPPWHQVPGTKRIYYVRGELERWMAGRGRAPDERLLTDPLTWNDLPGGLTWDDLPPRQKGPKEFHTKEDPT